MRQMKVWQIVVVAAIVLAAAAFTAVAIAAAGGDDDRGERIGMMGSGQNGLPQGGSEGGAPGWDSTPDGDGPRGYGGGMGQGRGVMGPDGEGLRGLGAQLTDDQRQQLDDLMDEHRADMQAWWDEYGEDPSASGAQEALQELRDEHRQEMQKLLNDLGIEAGGWGMGRDRDDRATPDAGSGSTTPCPNCDNEGISY